MKNENKLYPIRIVVVSGTTFYRKYSSNVKETGILINHEKNFEKEEVIASEGRLTANLRIIYLCA